MEHSLLHGLQLCGMIFALGGVLFRDLVLGPILKRLSAQESGAVESLESLINKWTYQAAFGGALASVLDLLVQVGELDGRTIYTGISLGTLHKYVFGTTVGQISAVKGLL